MSRSICCAASKAYQGVMPAYEADAISQLAGVQYTLRYHSLDVEAAKASSCDDGMHVRSDDADYVNRPILVEGSWPESDDECLLSVDNVWTSPVHIGDTVELLEGTQAPGWRVHHPHLYRRGFRAVLVLHVRYQYRRHLAWARASFRPSSSCPKGRLRPIIPIRKRSSPSTGRLARHGPMDAYQHRVDAVAQRLNDLAPRLSASRSRAAAARCAGRARR